MRMRWLLAPVSFFFLTAVGCSDDGSSTSGDGDSESGTAESGSDSAETGTATMGDGDGDPTTTMGDGDGDPGGDGDGTPGDGDGTPGDGDGAPGDGDGAPGDGDGAPGDGDGAPGDGDGAPNCPIGAEGCPCTGGGGCDPGLSCDMMTDTCLMPDFYGPCPGGNDNECAMGEICVTGNNNNTDWSLCTHPCNQQQDCNVDMNDGCGDLPGDGQFMNYCGPVFPCDMNNPCPMGMQCFQGFNNPGQCMWPI